MKKWKTSLIIAAVAFAVYGIVFTSPGGRSGSGDTGDEPQEYTVDPVLRLYTWENYWESDTQQARREVEMELGKTYMSGQLLHITQIHQGGDKYKTMCIWNANDNFFSGLFARYSGYFIAEYDGNIHAQHSSYTKYSLVTAETHDQSHLHDDVASNDGFASGKDHVIFVASCGIFSHNAEEEKKTETHGIEIVSHHLEDEYSGIPPALKNVKRDITTVTVTVKAMSDRNPDLPVAEAVVQIRHYEPWEGAELDELLAAGVPLQDTSYRQEMTLIEYTQIEDLGEALS